MKTATIEDFSAHVGDYLDCVQAGEEIALSREGCVVARLSPVQPQQPRTGAGQKPDIMSRLNAQFGARCMSAIGATALLDEVRSQR